MDEIPIGTIRVVHKFIPVPFVLIGEGDFDKTIHEHYPKPEPMEAKPVSPPTEKPATSAIEPEPPAEEPKAPAIEPEPLTEEPAPTTRKTTKT